MMRAISSAEGKAALATLLALGAIGGAWFSELVLHFVPCMLCLWERWPYYIGLPLVIPVFMLMRRPGAKKLAAAGLVLLGLIFLVSAGLGAYHSGVEWKWFTGPDCGGRLGNAPLSLDDFRKSLSSARVVLCTEAPMRVLGLSFAGWNAVASLVIAGLFLGAARQVQGSSSESQ